MHSDSSSHGLAEFFAEVMNSPEKSTIAIYHGVHLNVPQLYVIVSVEGRNVYFFVKIGCIDHVGIIKYKL